MLYIPIPGTGVKVVVAAPLALAIVAVGAALVALGACASKPAHTSLSEEPQRYFPPDSRLSQLGPEFEEDYRSRYAAFLQAMKEPAIYGSCDARKQVYRFLWLRSFHHPIAVRAESSGHEHLLTFSELHGQGGYDIEAVCRKKRRALSRAEWGQFTTLVRDTGALAEPPWELRVIGDGAHSVLEACEDGKYKLVSCHSPGPDEPQWASFREACLALLRLSRIHVREVY